MDTRTNRIQCGIILKRNQIFALACWNIWRWRNSVVFSEASVSLVQRLKHLRRNVGKCWSLIEAERIEGFEVVQAQRVDRLEPPPISVAKINTNGTWCVLRDHYGNWIAEEV